MRYIQQTSKLASPVFSLSVELKLKITDLKIERIVGSACGRSSPLNPSKRWTFMTCSLLCLPVCKQAHARIEAGGMGGRKERMKNSKEWWGREGGSALLLPQRGEQ